MANDIFDDSVLPLEFVCLKYLHFKIITFFFFGIFNVIALKHILHIFSFPFIVLVVAIRNLF